MCKTIKHVSVGEIMMKHRRPSFYRPFSRRF